MRSLRAYILLVAVVLVSAYVLRMFDPAPVARLRLLAFDTYQQLQPRKYDPDVAVRIIDIDEASLARLGQWPWPRSLIADLTKRLTEAGAAAVAFDLVCRRTGPNVPLRSHQALTKGDARSRRSRASSLSHRRATRCWVKQSRPRRPCSALLPHPSRRCAADVACGICDHR
jgi:CHASE2 domain-containing sensor protein